MVTEGARGGSGFVGPALDERQGSDDRRSDSKDRLAEPSLSIIQPRVGREWLSQLDRLDGLSLACAVHDFVMADSKTTRISTSDALARLTGVGPALAKRLATLGIRRPEELVFHLPLRYEDRTRITPIQRVRPVQRAAVLPPRIKPLSL